MLTVTNLSKSFFSNKVLSEVDFNVRDGEIHALIGENGAGKSTLINIIAGILSRDTGLIQFDGQDVNFTHPLEAMKAGIAVVHQELSLVPNATVTENMFLRREIKNSLGLNNWKAMSRAANEVFNKIGVDIDPNALAGSLSVGVQQLVEVAKAISLNAKLIIMDEPTSSLSEKEIAELFSVVRDLKSKGISIVFISHKLSELFEISDRITVLRDGRRIATVDTSSVDADEIIKMMVGRHLGELYPLRSSSIGEVIFSCRNLTRFGTVRDVNFDLRKGEILGIAGLVGAGRTEAMRAIINAEKRASGQFSLNGSDVEITNPSQALSEGIVYVSEDRKGSGLFLSFSVADNIGASTLPSSTNKFGILEQKKLRERARGFIKRMDVRPANELVRAISLSGGNQQKVLISKALDTAPKVLIVDEPTRGVDVGAKALIHAKLRELAEAGTGVIVVSSEMPEIIGISDRILVFRNGGISADLDNRAGNISQEQILTHAMQN